MIVKKGFNQVDMPLLNLETRNESKKMADNT